MIVEDLMFQLGHDFSAMEMASVMIATRKGTVGFNWATTFQPWRFLEALTAKTPEVWVSIGPRLFSHGDGGHFSPSTDIEKLAIFERYAN